MEDFFNLIYFKKIEIILKNFNFKNIKKNNLKNFNFKKLKVKHNFKKFKKKLIEIFTNIYSDFYYIF